MPKLKINKLPVLTFAEDYHQFHVIQSNLRLIAPKIKVKELGFYGGEYVGIIYKGNLRSPENKAVVKQVKIEIVFGRLYGPQKTSRGVSENYPISIKNFGIFNQ